MFSTFLRASRKRPQNMAKKAVRYTKSIRVKELIRVRTRCFTSEREALEKSKESKSLKTPPRAR